MCLRKEAPRLADHGARSTRDDQDRYELATVLAGRLNKGRRSKAAAILDGFLATLRIDIAPLDERLARLAMTARLDYGKGFGTRGGLSFGDCFAYALAKRHSAPLLYVGDAFALTDVQSALAR